MFSPFQKVVNILFPPLCLSCNSVLSHEFPLICEECSSLLLARGEFVCSSCGKRHPTNALKCHALSVSVFTAFQYENIPARKLIHALKYRGAESAAKTIAYLVTPLFLNALPHRGLQKNLEIQFIPIPLSPKRERNRGFNQSVLLSYSFAKELELYGCHASVNTKLIFRIRETPSQTTCKNKKERMANMRGCFSAKNCIGLENKLVLLVDDVVTSGATIEEASRTLKNAGVPHIVGLCIAKT